MIENDEIQKKNNKWIYTVFVNYNEMKKKSTLVKNKWKWKKGVKSIGSKYVDFLI